MIYDLIENAHLYYKLGDKFEKALKFLNDTDFDSVEPGRIDIDGDNIFALVQEYNTKDPEEGKWEAHRKYIDIQFVHSGGEDFGFVNVDYLESAGEYNAENDVEFFNGDGDFLQIHDDEFIILFPQDAHMPGLSIEDSEKIKKVVIKVLAD